MATILGYKGKINLQIEHTGESPFEGKIPFITSL